MRRGMQSSNLFQILPNLANPSQFAVNLDDSRWVSLPGQVQVWQRVA